MAAQLGPVLAENRLRASPHLSDAEQMVWARLVNDNPASAFTGRTGT